MKSYTSEGREPSRRRDATFRIEVLQRDNANQDTWLAAIRTYARARGFLTFLLVKHNANRVVKGSDFPRDGLLNPNIKQEPIDDVTEYDGQQLTPEELEEKAELDKKSLAEQHLANAQAGAMKATSAFVDLTELDDFEHDIFDSTLIRQESKR